MAKPFYSFLTPKDVKVTFLHESVLKSARKFSEKLHGHLEAHAILLPAANYFRQFLNPIFKATSTFPQSRVLYILCQFFHFYFVI